MKKVTKSQWLVTLLGTPIVIAILGFTMPIAWQAFRHRNVGPDYVEAAVHVENGNLLFFFRNNSDDPLDLVKADIEIKIQQAGNDTREFGAYPDTHIYTIDSPAAQLTQQTGRLLVTLGISQAIDARKADQFGFRIKDLAAGPFTPTPGSLQGKVFDSKGNVYQIRY